MNWKYNEDRTEIVLTEPPKKTLRITGHRFSTVLGLNQYATKFQAWAEITRLVKVPFVENKYIILGRYAEPKIIDYVRNKFPNVMSMEEYYGEALSDYKYNNFKYDSKIFGGMFDFVCTKNDKKTISLIGEIKTTSKVQLFTENNIPIEYQLQAALYAKLKGLDRVLFVVSFATEEDYMHPETFEPTDDNTILVVKYLSDMVFDINGEYCGIDDCVKKAVDFWDTYVKTGISPKFDEEKDKEYLDIIRASQPSNDNDLITLCNEGIKLAKEISDLKVTTGLSAKEKELKTIESAIKNKMIENQDECCGKYKLSVKVKSVFDEQLFAEKQEKLYNQFLTQKIEYKLSKNLKEEGDD